MMGRGRRAGSWAVTVSEFAQSPLEYEFPRYEDARDWALEVAAEYCQQAKAAQEWVRRAAEGRPDRDRLTGEIDRAVGAWLDLIWMIVRLGRDGGSGIAAELPHPDPHRGHVQFGIAAPSSPALGIDAGSRELGELGDFAEGAGGPVVIDVTATS